MALSSKDIRRILEKHGFVLSRQRGSHQQFVGLVHGKKTQGYGHRQSKKFRARDTAQHNPPVGTPGRGICILKNVKAPVAQLAPTPRLP